MTIYTPYLPNIAAAPELKTLESIIADIKNGKHSEQIKLYQSTHDKKYKKSLPLFLPTVQVFNENKLNDDSVATGIVQFDIDAKDNLNIDFTDLKAIVINIPETIYAFSSPSGGLKFGILTDFTKNTDDDIGAFKKRYNQAYKLVKNYILTYTTIETDESMKNLKYGCFLSSDSTAHYNSNCSIYEVNSKCTYNPPVYSTPIDSTLDDGKISELLSYIPDDLSYNDRLPINFAVFTCIGEAGIPLLLHHWNKSDKGKLKNQLESQCKSNRKSSNTYGGATLYHEAIKHGYKTPTGKAIGNIKPEPIDYNWTPMVTPVEANKQLTKIMQEFFDTKKDAFVSISTGAGKTKIAIDFLKNTGRSHPLKKQSPFWNRRILYLVPTHKLAKEIVERIDGRTYTDEEYKSHGRQLKKIKHIQGRNRLCENNTALQAYNEAGVSMPYEQCTDKHCPYRTGCAYIEQFNDISNLRIMTHNEYTGLKGTWLYGSDDKDKPRKHGWKPDYIIVDEDCIELDVHEETINTEYSSIRNIINDVMNGGSFEDAINKHSEDVLTDYDYMRSNQNKKPEFISTKQYLNESTTNKSARWSIILRLLKDYIITGVDAYLAPLNLYDDKLATYNYKSVATRYETVPTLYLDATANKSIINSIIPEARFYRILVKQNENINVYQSSNFTILKNWLIKDKLNKFKLANGIKKLIAKYNNVGLITYKRVGEEHDFDKWLANEAGIKLYDHFGNIRGSDKFKDVDCLIIAGRHLMNTFDIRNRVLPLGFIENDYLSGFKNKHLVDVPVRVANNEMLTNDSNDKAMTVKNRIYSNNLVQNVINQFCTSETIQAVGRARLVHGKAKDVYILSNESLGDDVVITDFIERKDFISEMKYQDVAIKLKEIGFCQCIKLGSLGVSENVIKKNRNEIEQELLDAGIDKHTFNIKDSNRNTRPVEYYVHSMDALVHHLDEQGKKIIPNND